MFCCLALQLVTNAAAWASDTKACDVAPMHGFNLIQDQQAPFGSAQALDSMKQMRATGTNTVAFVPFLWQRQSDSADIARGSDMTDEQLAQGIRAAHRLGMRAIVKPQVWVPGTWAGAVHMNSEADWTTWFARYESALANLASVAQREHAEGLVVGTELDQTVSRAEWPTLIARIRAVYRGNLTYVAHNVDGAEQVPFWSRLDEIGVTLIPHSSTTIVPTNGHASCRQRTCVCATFHNGKAAPCLSRKSACARPQALPRSRGKRGGAQCPRRREASGQRVAHVVGHPQQAAGADGTHLALDQPAGRGWPRRRPISACRVNRPSTCWLRCGRAARRPRPRPAPAKVARLHQKLRHRPAITPCSRHELRPATVATAPSCADHFGAKFHTTLGWIL